MLPALRDSSCDSGCEANSVRIVGLFGIMIVSYARILLLFGRGTEYQVFEVQGKVNRKVASVNDRRPKRLLQQ